MPGQGGSGGFRVHPEEVQAAGRTAEDIAAQVPGEMAGVLGASDRTVGALGPWQTGAALHECTESWRALLTGLSAEMDRRGQSLITCAQGYQDADSSVAAEVTAAARG